MKPGVLSYVKEKCDGCGECEKACRDSHGGRALLWLMREAQTYNLITCKHCSDPMCRDFCPAGAIEKHKDSGLVEISEARCIGCGMCALGCQDTAVDWDSEAHVSHKCDLCGGDPKCVAVCKPRALEFLSPSKAKAISTRLYASRMEARGNTGF